MGKIINFPDKGVKAPEKAEEFNRSLPEATTRDAHFRRAHFRVIKGGKK